MLGPFCSPFPPGSYFCTIYWISSLVCVPKPQFQTSKGSGTQARQDRPKICVGYQSLKSKRKLGNENFLSFFIFIYFCFILFWLCYPKGIFFTQCDSASLWTCDYFVLTNQDLAPMLSGVAKLLKFAWHRGCNSNDRDCCYCCCCCCCGSCLHDCCYDT